MKTRNAPRNPRMSTRGISRPNRNRQRRNANDDKEWLMGLMRDRENPELKVIETPKAIVIKDKFPKARVHYLVLPTEDIASVSELNSTHISLLDEFKELWLRISREHKNEALKAGFHAENGEQGMYLLHMHIISIDMVSPGLKHQKHWNTFNTKYFMPYTEVLKELKENGRIRELSGEEYQRLMDTPLQCNQCFMKPENISELKQHLLTHDKP